MASSKVELPSLDDLLDEVIVPLIRENDITVTRISESRHLNRRRAKLVIGELEKMGKIVYDGKRRGRNGLAVDVWVIKM